MLIGAHVSTTPNYDAMVDYALSVGCECIQMYAKSPKMWRSKAVDPAAAARLKELRAERGLGPILTHTAYLINLTTTKPDIREKSIPALADEIARGALLGVDGVNTHLGAVPDGTREDAGKRCAEAIRLAYEIAGPEAADTRLILENAAGQGTTYGGSMEELAIVIHELGMPKEKVGICIDTCHAWAYGYDTGSAQGWDDLLTEMENLAILDRLAWIHANDCIFGRGERKDRHAWIGEGQIGVDGFAAMVTDPRLADVNVVVEMPGEIPEKDVVNIELLKSLRDA